MKKGTRLVLFLLVFLFVIFLVSFVSAAVSVGKLNYSLATSYEPGAAISGWVNISLANEPTTATLKSSFGESINLLELLKKGSNSGFVKTCNTAGCVSNYVASNP